MAHGKFEFNGTGIGYLGVALLSFILTAITLGLYGPIARSIDGKQSALSSKVNH